jgi:hypothetical protein
MLLLKATIFYRFVIVEGSFPSQRVRGQQRS